MVVFVEKRDGKKTSFKKHKIVNAISKAMRATNNLIDIDVANTIASKIEEEYDLEVMSVEDIQDRVEELLMESDYKEVAKNYIIYRKERDVNRKRKANLTKIFKDIVEIKDNDIKNENGNMDANTPSGQMMKVASEAMKEFALNELLDPLHAKAHKIGRTHVHDLDYLGTRSSTCTQIPLGKMLEEGYSTTHGNVRESKHIRSYAANAAIIMQTNQNIQHGGQSFDAMDYYMANGVKKTFKSYFLDEYARYIGLRPLEIKQDKDLKERLIAKVEAEYGEISISNEKLKNSLSLQDCYEIAYDYTVEETLQAMESFVCNMNSMHSRGK